MNSEKRNYAGIAVAVGISPDRCNEPPPLSPVALQLNALHAQLTSIENTVGQLIDGTRSILSGDPRHEPACEPPEQAFSCQLEQTLASIGGRLDSLDRILSRTLRSIQL